MEAITIKPRLQLKRDIKASNASIALFQSCLRVIWWCSMQIFIASGI